MSNTWSSPQHFPRDFSVRSLTTTILRHVQACLWLPTAAGQMTRATINAWHAELTTTLCIFKRVVPTQVVARATGIGSRWEIRSGCATAHPRAICTSIRVLDQAITDHVFGRFNFINTTLDLLLRTRRTCIDIIAILYSCHAEISAFSGDIVQAERCINSDFWWILLLEITCSNQICGSRLQ